MCNGTPFIIQKILSSGGLKPQTARSAGQCLTELPGHPINFSVKPLIIYCASRIWFKPFLPENSLHHKRGSIAYSLPQSGYDRDPVAANTVLIWGHNIMFLYFNVTLLANATDRGSTIAIPGLCPGELKTQTSIQQKWLSKMVTKMVTITQYISVWIKCYLSSMLFIFNLYIQIFNVAPLVKTKEIF